jgi:GTPase SAR1 family protein
MNLPSRHIPEFAVLGHPNEGKSSVVSTLTEDDQIRVSPVPGETTVSRTYTVEIDKKKIIRFVDTPGFQVPRQTLAWFRAYTGDSEKILEHFIDAFREDPFFADECELMTPVARGAGIIYVVNGSRPVREDDIAEMEILRLTGRPRMAIINSKQTGTDYTREWKLEFRKYFNSIRVFNSNTADFKERIRMLESLKSIDQEWEDSLSKVILAFQEEWKKRNRLACAYITLGLEKSLGFSVSEKLLAAMDPVQARERLNLSFQQGIREIEQEMFAQIKSLFKHTLYDYPLPEYSLLQHDLFAKQTWELLGLTQKQLAAAGAVAGGTMGMVMDTAAGGLTFGVFTAIGGLLGAGSALWSGKKIARKTAHTLQLGGDRLQVGPNQNLQFLYVLLDRVLIYYAHMINRPHGRRDMISPVSDTQAGSSKMGISAALSSSRRNVCARFFKSVSGKAVIKGKKAIPEFAVLVESLLDEIADREI